MKKGHWALQNERGNILALTIMRRLVAYFPLWLIRPILFGIVLYFYLTSRRARRNIARYQYRLRRTFPKLPQLSVWRQFMAFGDSLLDRFAVWQGKIRYRDLLIEDDKALFNILRKPNQGRGQILLCSHFGNVEICRAFANKHPYFRLNVLVYGKHAQAFNQALQEAGAEKLSLIQVETLNIELMLELQKRIEEGEWIAIAADRIPIRGAKTEKVRFLGDNADFPQGPWLLSALLKAPLNTLFCVKEKGRYRVKLQPFLPVISGAGMRRRQNILLAMQKYADLLAQECAKNPLLWFNFYNFWNDED
ncbi:putative LPLAT superfamily acyltransferase [Mesocricetibacter intestinalis]|uniref:Putative LPLAT superfamily acyltransferase n=1 Tax=Mesocricetibacter intestinalis TaxID=1521930 RepID=A0A4R6VHH3_9PAST|nr:glycosyl transferase family 2 [Mesocricetibacter intestinalis]TDQ57678.1 putative LPLAT superfamily acyltransferase [Mesocricetibacter intestinalis]